MATESENKLWSRLDTIVENQAKQSLQDEKLSSQIDLVKLKVDNLEQKGVLERQSQDKSIARLEQAYRELKDEFTSHIKHINEKVDPLGREIAKAQVVFAIIAAGIVIIAGFVQAWVFK